jgi:EpsI family protein
MKSFWQAKTTRILSFVLIAQAALFYGFSRAEKVPSHSALAQFSLENSPWRMVNDVEMDKESLEVLRADDLLSRVYTDPQTGQTATLFVAYFATQRTGKAPHSPKNCLPGSGWVQDQAGETDIKVPGQAQPIRVNEYVVSRGQNKSVVLYWYQTHNRVIASEYSAKMYTVADSIRFNRSDTALVRVVVGVDNGDTAKAIETAKSFVQTFFEPLKEYLPA